MAASERREEEFKALFARAREADIEQVAGVKLFRAGRRLRGGCPICKASMKKRTDGAFSVNPLTGWFDCFACGEDGDVIRLEQLLGGGSALDAAERLAGAVHASTPRVVRQPKLREVVIDPDALDPDEVAFHAWFGGKAAPGTPAEAYLRSRLISGPVLDAALPQVRFNPSVPWGGRRSAPILLPAMVGQVRTQGGVTGGVHVTYLAPDGSRKAARTPAKRMWGPQTRDGRAGGVWLIGPHGEGPLVVGEGIENSLAAAMKQDGPCRVASALSLGGLQGWPRRDREGAFDPGRVLADLDRPAFTWRARRQDQWEEVLIAVDLDMKPIKIWTRDEAGERVQIELDAEARAELCASLAVQHWRSTDTRCAIAVLRPGAGCDFTDELAA